MKIKTITCHHVYNYGASLQAHALMFYLSELGHDVEVIDYMPEYIRRHISLWNIGKRWDRNIFIKLAYYCYVVPIRLCQKRSRKMFDDFTQKFIKLTKRYNSYRELANNCPESDLYFCGSDQIWNPTINNGLDPAFYLDFAPANSTRASYAASFSVSAIEDKDCAFVKEMLNKLDFISVRENTGLKIIKNLGIQRNATNVMDPVFLPSYDHWKSMTYTPNYNNYILVYDQENNVTIQSLAKKLSKETGKKIIAFKDLYPRTYADIKINQSGPIDFISLISQADYVLTNSFHCCAFSIIFRREFFVIPRMHQKVNSRMADLLSSLNIKDHMCTSTDDMGKISRINYEEVGKRLSELQKTSYKFIDDVINFAQNKRSKC